MRWRVFRGKDWKVLKPRLKKYKLASSEGVNKLSNRITRFETLYKICIDSGDEVKEVLLRLENDFAKKLKSKNKKDDLEQDDLVDMKEE